MRVTHPHLFDAIKRMTWVIRHCFRISLLRSLFYFRATMADINLWIIYKLTVKRTAVHTRFSAQNRPQFFPKNRTSFQLKISRRYVRAVHFESDGLIFVLLFRTVISYSECTRDAYNSASLHIHRKKTKSRWKNTLNRPFFYRSKLNAQWKPKERNYLFETMRLFFIFFLTYFSVSNPLAYTFVTIQYK